MPSFQPPAGPDLPGWLADPAAHVDDLGRYVTDKSFQVGGRVQAAGALGEARTERAAPYLHAALSEAETSDLKCVLMLALARAIGSGATEDLAPLLDARSVRVRDLAFIIEGHVGDLRIMERMLSEWSKITKASRGRQASWSLDVIRYLGRHFDHFEQEQRTAIVRGGHRVWQGLDKPPWLRDRWPAMTVEAPTDLRPAPLIMTETLDDLFGKTRGSSSA